MNVEHINGQIVGCQVHRLENLVERTRLSLFHADRVIAVVFYLLLDETQQMLLVHRRGRMNVRVHLSHPK